VLSRPRSEPRGRRGSATSGAVWAAQRVGWVAYSYRGGGAHRLGLTFARRLRGGAVPDVTTV